MFYKLELTNDNRIIVLDIVEDKQDDEFIYATPDEFKKLKQSCVIDYNQDVFNSFSRTVTKEIAKKKGYTYDDDEKF